MHRTIVWWLLALGWLVSACHLGEMPPRLESTYESISIAWSPVQGAPGKTAMVAYRPIGRSEERRVGKECRSRWSPYH